MNTFTPELQQWAAEVIEKISPIAEEINLAYYPLQSEAKMNPELLIIGLNPRAEDEKIACLDSQRNNPIWEFEDGKMTVERILKGNPCYSEKDTWNVMEGIENTDFIKKAIKDNSYCFMNYIFFSTKDENALKNLKEFKKIEEYLNIPYPLGSHSLRKTWGKNVYDATLNIALIMKVFNHSSPGITLKYIGIEEEDINKLYEGIEI